MLLASWYFFMQDSGLELPVVLQNSCKSIVLNITLEMVFTPLMSLCHCYKLCSSKLLPVWYIIRGLASRVEVGACFFPEAQCFRSCTVGNKAWNETSSKSRLVLFVRLTLFLEFPFDFSAISGGSCSNAVAPLHFIDESFPCCTEKFRSELRWLFILLVLSCHWSPLEARVVTRVIQKDLPKHLQLCTLWSSVYFCPLPYTHFCLLLYPQGVFVLLSLWLLLQSWC